MALAWCRVGEEKVLRLSLQGALPALGVTKVGGHGSNSSNVDNRGKSP